MLLRSMSRAALLALCFALLGLVAGCGRDETDAGDTAQTDEQQVRAVVEEFNAAWRRGDGETACSLLTPKSAHSFDVPCRRYFSRTANDATELKVLDVLVRGDLAVVQTRRIGVRRRKGTTVTAQRIDGEWRVSYGLLPERYARRLLEEAKSTMVLATGTTPNGEPFEITANGPREVCVNFNWVDPATDTGGVGRCNIDHSFEPPIEPPMIFDWRGADGHAVFGLASADVAEVVVSYRLDGDSAVTEAPVQLFPIPTSTAEDVGATEPIPPIAAYVAFLPNDVGDVTGTSDAEAIARDSTGEELGRTRIAWTFWDTGRGKPIILPCRDGRDSFCRRAISQRDVFGDTPVVPASLTRALVRADHDAFVVPPRNPLGEVKDPREAADAAIGKYGDGFTGVFAVYAAERLKDKRLVYVVHLSDLQPLGHGGAMFTEREAPDGFGGRVALDGTVVIVDATTGDPLKAVELGGVSEEDR